MRQKRPNQLILKIQKSIRRRRLWRNRTLKNSSQFIRKVNNLYPGISCYTIDQNTLILMEASQKLSNLVVSLL
jgi:hypothetical protein